MSNLLNCWWGFCKAFLFQIIDMRILFFNICISVFFFFYLYKFVVNFLYILITRQYIPKMTGYLCKRKTIGEFYLWKEWWVHGNFSVENHVFCICARGKTKKFMSLALKCQRIFKGKNAFECDFFKQRM